MKHITLFVLFCFLSYNIKAQNYQINTFNGQTVTNCSGNATFLDSGGQFGNHQSNENYTITFCPTSTTQVVNIDFTTFSIGTGDQLCIFDGNNTLATLLGCYYGTNFGFNAIASNPTGCLTVQFISDFTNHGAGWVADVTCQTPCQQVIAGIQSSTPPIVPIDTGYIDICLGQSISLTGEGIFPDNDSIYHQSNATSTFEWLVEGQVVTGQTLNHTFSQPGGYRIQLQVTDTIGCKSTNQLDQRVRVAAPVTFDGSNLSPNFACAGDTLFLNGFPNVTGGSFATPLSQGDSIFLPDGTGVCYQTSLTFTEFNFGQTITSVNDLQSICVNMEHTWVGDLDLSIICPNGQTVVLHPQVGIGGGTNLGEPLFSTAPGVGYDYCWDPNTTNPTWQQALSTGSGIINVNGQQTLAPGTYASSQNLNGLVGCPLNGQWQLQICDNLSIDDGYIFGWSIALDPSLYPNLEAFTPQIVNSYWQVDTGRIYQDTVAFIPTVGGNTTYSYVVENEFGCEYDTSFNINVVTPPNQPSLVCGNANASSVTVNWTPDPFAQYYELNVNNIGWQVVNGSSYTLGGLSPNTPVFFELRAIGPPPCDFVSPIDTLTCSSLPCNLVTNLLSVNNVTCVGAADGSAVFSSSTDIGPITYLLDNVFSTTDSVVAPIDTGNHIIVVSDANTCRDTFNFSITQPTDTFVVTGVSTNVACGNDSTATATLTVSGGVTPYTYSWSHGPTTQNVTNLPKGIYFVTATDASNCQRILSFTVNGPPALSLSAQNTNVSCFQGNDGTAIAFGAGGTGSISYLWNTGDTTANISDLIAGTYTVSITDTNNCSIATSVIVTEPNDLVVALDSNRVTCANTMDGSVLSTVTGGTMPYSYLWSNNETTPNIDSLNSGMYSVTVTDSLGCVTIDSVPVFEPTPITNTLFSSQVTCFGLTDGFATVTPSGGTGVYTYLWNSSPNQTTATMSNSPGGDFIVTVTDSDGCQAIDSVFVFAPQLVFIDTMLSTPVVCYGGTEGTVSTNGFGGTGTLTYLWNNGVGDSSQVNLSAGQYTVTVSDQQGCIAIDSIIVDGPDSLAISFNTTPLNCYQDGTGSVISNVTGGTMPYNYAWNTNQSSTALSNLQIGTYTLTITDANNCVTIDSSIVVEPQPLSVAVDAVNPLCFGDANGSIGLIPNGGNGNYQYSWNTTTSTDSALSNLMGGYYAYTVKDAKNCTVQNLVFLIEPAELVVDAMAVNVTCRDSLDGQVIAQTIGGTAPYSYDWIGQPAADSILYKLNEGWYTVEVTDTFGCAAIDSAFVVEPSYINTLVTATDLSCFESGDGAAAISANGGVGNFSYVWSTTSQTTATVTGLDVGWQYVTVTDGNNCPKQDSVLLNQPTEIIPTIASTALNCFNDNTGTATVGAIGGAGGYTYNWSTTPNQTTSTATNLSANTYIVTVTDVTNCSVQDTVLVTEPTELQIMVSSTDMTCFQVTNGTATVTVSGGTPNLTGYTYLWNNNATTPTITNLDKGTYTVTVTDANGCIKIGSTTIKEPPLLTSTISELPASCHAGSDGTGIVTASGGTPASNGTYNYLWSTPIPQILDTAFNLIGGLTYMVTISDANGCLDSNTITISHPTPITLTTTTTNTLCDYSNEGTATVNSSGGTMPYTYLWNASANAQDSMTAINLEKGEYKVTVTDANGCAQPTNIVIDGPDAINVIGTITDNLCKGDADGIIEAEAGGGTVFYNFQWSNGKGTPTIANLTADTYVVTVTDNNGCIEVDSFEVGEPIDALSATLDKKDITCYGDRDGQIVINAVGGTLPYLYSLNNDTVYTNANSIAGLTEGTYFIDIQDDNGCTFKDTVTVSQPDLFTVSLPIDTTVEAGKPAPLVPVIQNGKLPITFDWTPKDSTLTCWDCPIPTLQNLWQTQTYSFLAVDANGCVATADIIVYLDKPRKTYVATGFSPNGDGYNDRFFIQGGDGVEMVQLLRVYDRWGELVFETSDTPVNDAQFGWDGIFRGEKAPGSVYSWYAEIVHTDGEVILYKGNVTLVR